MEYTTCKTCALNNEPSEEFTHKLTKIHLFYLKIATVKIIMFHWIWMKLSDYCSVKKMANFKPTKAKIVFFVRMISIVIKILKKNSFPNVEKGANFFMGEMENCTANLLIKKTRRYISYEKLAEVVFIIIYLEKKLQEKNHWWSWPFAIKDF